MEKEYLRKIDALVAEHIFGYAVRKGGHSLFPDYYIQEDSAWVSKLVHYSSSISAAWEVAGKAEGVVALTIYMDKSTLCEFDKGSHRDGSAPLAICLAALKAVGVEPPKEEA